jgi:NADH dehydrogenase
VVGGGFGGVNVSRVLAKADVDVTLIDRTNHHLFPAAALSGCDRHPAGGLIAPALRRVVHKQENTNVVLGQVVDIDLQARTVCAVAPTARRYRCRTTPW